MNIYILGYIFLFQSIRCLQSLYVVWIYEAVYSKNLDWSCWSLNMTHGFNDLFNNPPGLFIPLWNKKWPKYITRWWFQIFFIFIPTWGRFPFWLFFFSNGLKPPTRSDWWNTVACGYIVHPNKVSFRQNLWRSLVDWWLGPPQGVSHLLLLEKKGHVFFPTGKRHAMKVCKQQIDTHWICLIFFVYILLLSLYIDYCYYVFLHYVCSCFFCDFFVYLPCDFIFMSLFVVSVLVQICLFNYLWKEQTIGEAGFGLVVETPVVL